MTSPTTCPECGATFIAMSAEYLSCPNGHGKLIRSGDAGKAFSIASKMALAMKAVCGLPRANRNDSKGWISATWNIVGLHSAYTPVGWHRAVENIDWVKTDAKSLWFRGYTGAVVAWIRGEDIGKPLPRVAVFVPVKVWNEMELARSDSKGAS